MAENYQTTAIFIPLRLPVSTDRTYRVLVKQEEIPFIASITGRVYPLPMEITPHQFKMAASMFDVFVGSETGLLKGFNVSKQTWDNLNSLETADTSNEICSICWNDRYSKVLCLGLRNHTVKLFDSVSNNFLEPCVLRDCDGKLRSLVSVEDSFITATDSGRVYSWKDEKTSLLLDTKANLHCMSQNPQQKSVISTGGKENDLMLWDLNNITCPIFQAKNVRNDWLNLRVPVWVTGACFLHSDKIVTCTGHHQVRVYDYKSSQRRPVLDLKFDEYPITAMSLVHTNDNQVIVGNSQGKMGLLDIRQGKLVHLYKGFAGGIRSVQCHATKPVVASCGLDRFLRIHDIDAKALLYKVYMKSRLNCVVMTENWGEERVVTTGKNTVSDGLSSDKDMPGHEDDDNDIDDVWDNMEVVKTRTVKKSGQKSTDTSNKNAVKIKRKLEPTNPRDAGIPAPAKKSRHKRSKKNRKMNKND